MSTPWSTEVVAVEADDGVGDRWLSPRHLIRVSLMLTTDPGPMREFLQFLDFDLDEAHATELLGKLTLALRDLRERAAVNDHAAGERA